MMMMMMIKKIIIILLIDPSFYKPKKIQQSNSKQEVQYIPISRKLFS